MAGDRKIYVQQGATYIENQTNYIRGNQVFGKPEDGDDKKKVDQDAPDLNPLQKELLPIFMNDMKEMMLFVKAINGAKPKSITDLVNRLVTEDKIVKNRRKNDLYGILNKYGFYQLSLQNWCQQVN